MNGRVNGILTVSSFCEVCSAVSCLWLQRSQGSRQKLAHFLAFVLKVGVITAEASQSEKLREWDGIFYVLWMRGRM